MSVSYRRLIYGDSEMGLDVVLVLATVVFFAWQATKTGQKKL